MIGLPCGAATVLSIGIWWLAGQVGRRLQSRVADRKLAGQRKRALAYQSRFATLLETSARRQEQAQLRALTEQVNRWTESIEALIVRVDRFKRDRLIRQEMADIPFAIRQLEQQESRENDGDLQSSIQRVIGNRRRHLAALENLQAIMRKAELEIEHTLSSLGIVYSQVLAGQSSNHVALYSRLSTEIDDQIEVLEDYLVALEEVRYASDDLSDYAHLATEVETTADRLAADPAEPSAADSPSSQK